MIAAAGGELLPPPNHLAIIMDGNGRWASARGLPRVAGHRKGAEAVRAAIRAAEKLGIRYLTLYSFSSENWKRPADEVDDLMGLLRLYLKREIKELHQNGVRVRIIGNRARLAPDIQTLIQDAEKMTAGNPGLTVVIALSYGAREEIVLAVKDMLAAGLDPASIDEAAISRRLFTTDIPDPDLILRTSGEQRLSNFLLWQSAYSELMFIDTLWPDFGEADMERVVSDYRKRERRYGGR
ncbi:isoprenyl transferase [Lacibacterium aquatile]|uniref:Isoprenyl transferase n=1 Tax=Lacibacterium aquatile TaxID=1168082 RepID=A0ABW5DJI8_9PROT